MLPEQVVITDNTGDLAVIPKLTVNLGGTGQDFSGVGVGPIIPTISNGVFSAFLNYSKSAISNALVQMDIGGAISVGVVSATSLATTLITSLSNINFSSSGAGYMNLLNMPFLQTPTNITGGVCSRYVNNITTTDALPSLIFSLPTVNNTTYTIQIIVSWGRLTGDSASQIYSIKVKNVAGIVSLDGYSTNSTIKDITLTTTNITSTINLNNVNVFANGLAATNINWCGCFLVVSQTLPLI